MSLTDALHHGANAVIDGLSRYDLRRIWARPHHLRDHPFAITTKGMLVNNTTLPTPAPADSFALTGANALGAAAGGAEPYAIDDSCLDGDWIHLSVGHRRAGGTWHCHSLTLYLRNRAHLVEELRSHRAAAPADPLVNDHTIEREFADCRPEPHQCEEFADGTALIAAVTQSANGHSTLHIDTVTAPGVHAYAADVVLTPPERERLIAVVTTGGEVIPARNPLTDPPPGFPAAGLNIYDGEDCESLFTFGHVDVERMAEAVADYVRHTQFAPDVMVKDPLASLIGGAARVRAGIIHGYALFDPRPIGFCAFSVKLLVPPSTPHAWPITYWEGGDQLPDLPEVPYLCGESRAARTTPSTGSKHWPPTATAASATPRPRAACRST
ncbi:hypothetical protein ACFQ0B_81320 [Nonomuraea thailandensis]